ncbi:MAG: 30S ribosomal protein S11 [Verrucomicrobiales bacterium]|nr:30S ribosomal protein S11 [Verrucomicrobiales bacterium]|tara:strand:- start:8468 stop:9106 length:639 start_codon:yes stop_codon:yes gene_type:complete
MADEQQEKHEAQNEQTEAKAPEPVSEEKPAEAKTEEKPVDAKAETKEKPSGKKAEKAEDAKPDGESDDKPNVAAPTAAELLADEPADVKVVKSKKSRNVSIGIVHILATFNNTHVTITDTQGNPVSWSTAGRCGFKGSRKSTAYAAQQVAQRAAREAQAHGLREVEVRVKGPGSGRESAIRALQAVGLDVTVIKDVTPVPHNGCRPGKRRRV